VLQDTDGQFVGQTAAEDIAFAAENDCVEQAEMRRRVLDAARLVDMEGKLGSEPASLSGGQKQRISMAGVLIDEVDILLFDEPLANLDPAAGKDAMEIIDRLYGGGGEISGGDGGGKSGGESGGESSNAGKTVIIVEHRLEDVLHRPVDRIILIDKGRIIADMPPAALLATSLLRETGIREPLYLSALRYAGISITAESRGDDLARLVFDEAKLCNWNATLPPAEAPPPSPPLLELRGVSFSYPESPGVRTLDDISFTIPQGAAIALVGKNGAGKSTLAKLICGFVKPDAGSVFFEGKDLAPLSIKERAERIGFVMQNPNLMFSRAMIFDEAALALRNRGISEVETNERVLSTLEVCGLYPFRNWPISALSYGQKKRLAVAAILVTDIKLIILDEPTAGQDYRHYTEIMEFLRRLNRERNLGILMVTHDMHLMLEYASGALVLADGKLLHPQSDGAGRADNAGCSGGADRSGLINPAEVLTSDDIIEKAALKRTSLYGLAERAGIPNGREFVRRFVEWERRTMQERHEREGAYHG